MHGEEAHDLLHAHGFKRTVLAQVLDNPAFCLDHSACKLLTACAHVSGAISVWQEC